MALSDEIRDVLNDVHDKVFLLDQLLSRSKINNRNSPHDLAINDLRLRLVRVMEEVHPNDIIRLTEDLKL